MCRKASFKLPLVPAPCWLLCQPSLEQLKEPCWLPVVQDSWRETPGCGLWAVLGLQGSKYPASVCMRHSTAKTGDSSPEGTALAEGCPSAAAGSCDSAVLLPLCRVGEAGGGAAQFVFAKCVPHPCCRLRPVDVEFMKALHEKVNIVPLIAKADCLIPSEIRKLKERVRCSFCTQLFLK